MAKVRTEYCCNACGAISTKWQGQCSDCGVWNSMLETIAESSSSKPDKGGRFAGYTGDAGKIQKLKDVEQKHIKRLATGLSELDRVLGGGLVPGSVVLIGGDPGVGKSTLLLQCLCQLSLTQSSLYVTGEESAEQVSMRARRLELPVDSLQVLTETQVEKITQAALIETPKIMVVDSIQTIYTDALQSAPGGVAQVRESAAQLVRFAKQTGTALFLVGHVTKDGAIAGPRVLEHMVDAVLYFEGGGDSRFRVIRAVKNRFGAVNELGVFAMTDRGLKEVKNPSAIFLSRYGEPVSGSVVTVTWEGSRPLLVEVQALLDESQLANPRRLAVGLDQNRLAMLLAVLHRHGGIACMDQDVFLNVVGGVRVMETSADLALIVAIISSFKNRVVDARMLTFGEVGLAGEVRPVPNGQDRLREAVKHGFTKAIVPKANAPQQAIDGLEVIAVSRISEVVDLI